MFNRALVMRSEMEAPDYLIRGEVRWRIPAIYPIHPPALRGDAETGSGRFLMGGRAFLSKT